MRTDTEYLLLSGADVLARVADHWPEIDGDVDDSTWLTCSCGWDSSEPKAVDWYQHLVDAITVAKDHSSA